MNRKTTQVSIDCETLEAFDKILQLFTEALTAGAKELAEEIQKVLESMETSIALSVLDAYRKTKNN